jgi:hypothetical protein
MRKSFIKPRIPMNIVCPSKRMKLKRQMEDDVLTRMAHLHAMYDARGEYYGIPFDPKTIIHQGKEIPCMFFDPNDTLTQAAIDHSRSKHRS